MEAAGGQAKAGGSRLDGEKFFLRLVCLSRYYKFRSYLDPETVWRPEGTTAASRREVKEGQDGSSMASQVQKRALSGPRKPNRVSYPCLGTANPWGFLGWERGMYGATRGLKAAQKHWPCQAWSL